MAPEGTKRIRIAVAVTLNGDWAAYGRSAAESMTSDEIDFRNEWGADGNLRAEGAEPPFRINMVEATVILPILENKDVVVQAEKVD